MTRSQSSSIVLYDFLKVRGGAEAVALDLAEALHASELCVDFCADRSMEKSISQRGVRLRTLGTPSCQGVEYLKGIHHFTRRTSFIASYDVVVYSGVVAPCAVRSHPGGRNVLYCHTIPRFAFDLKHYWLRRASWWQAPPLRALSWYVGRRYRATLSSMDLIIANSENVRRRMLRYLGWDSVVVHPPCNLERFSWNGQGDYYLSTARTEPYKRVRTVVRAFVEMPDRKLIVASGGSELEELKRLAEGAKNIHFTGWLPDEDLAGIVGNAIATLYIPIDEDFGISPVESMAAGKPVIGVAEGGLLETVLPEETGILMDPDPAVSDIVNSVGRMTPELALSMRAACEQRAALFGRDVFIHRIRQALASPGGIDGRDADGRR